MKLVLHGRPDLNLLAAHFQRKRSVIRFARRGSLRAGKPAVAALSGAGQVKQVWIDVQDRRSRR
ncbi:hypothetical protein JQ607_18280 [Bradyrhizobium liaoningense]|uniref:hypothetical protein n=1 Tax=Bradyrhizobium liaoningense TaxID=43992 RepID=UPI001BA9C5DE|nr:hypothetical protein [Bradyrhizobium liaoningense]MBR0842151.1 hypothetical protein [Bradyrhizobium liaoningense]